MIGNHDIRLRSRAIWNNLPLTRLQASSLRNCPAIATAMTAMSKTTRFSKAQGKRGENDPEKPRSMAKPSKWTIVFILSFSSACVHVLLA